MRPPVSVLVSARDVRHRFYPTMRTIHRMWMMPALCAAGFAMTPLPAQEKDAEPFKDPEVNEAPIIQVRVEFVEMSHKKLTELLFLDDEQTSDATAMRNTVAELVKSGEANVLETMMASARDSQKASSESTNEYIYPTEYEPAEIPTEVDLPDKQGGVTADDIKALSMMATPATPTAFETRDLGSTMEIWPTRVSEKKISLIFAPEIVWHTGNTVWTERKDGLGNVSKIEMPQFYKLSFNTALTFVDGQYNLVAVLSPKDQNGITDFTRKVMVFVRCDIKTVPE